MKRLLEAIGDVYAQEATLQLEEILKADGQNKAGIPFVLPETVCNKAGSEGQDDHSSIFASDDTTLNLTDENIRQAVSAYIQSADKALKCKENEKEYVPLEILIEHKATICGNSGKEGLLEHSFITTIFGESMPGKYKVIKAKEDFYRRNADSSRWNEYEWFVYNCLKHFSVSREKAESERGQSLHSKQAIKFSNVYVVSKAFAKRVQLSLKSFIEYVRKKANVETQQCLIILDFRDEDVLKSFKDDDDIFEKHTVVKIADVNLEREQSPYIVLTLHLNAELSIRKEGSGIMRDKSGAMMIQKCLYKCMTKLGPENISKITFENIRFDDPSTKIKISTIPKLETLILKSCIFTPDFPSSLVSVEVQDEERRLSHYLNQLNIIFPITVQKCQCLEYIKSSGIKIGSNEFCIKLNTSYMETNAENNYGKKLKECDKNQILGLLNYETLKILGSTSCDLKDFEQTEKEGRKAVLDGVCYGLRESDQNLVYVYPAEFYKNKKSVKIVLVTYMRENFDFDKECVWGTHRGFKTFKKSYYHVCPKLPDKKFDDNKINILDDYFENSYKNINETIREHSKQLMENHSNLEVIGISIGEADNPTDGPYIALYIRSKSFVPYGENLFPTELKLPTNTEISFKTVVREDFFVPLADSRAATFNALEKVRYLAMGCSIGFQGNDSGASLGPFVEYQSDGEMETGFLTACHLFSLPEDAHKVGNKIVVQPCEDDVFVDIQQPNQETSTSSVCGFTVANVFDKEVDASLVKITDRAPDTDRFISCQRRNIRGAGFERGLPSYKDGSIKDLDNCVGKRVVKFGQKTNLTVGKCIGCATVRLSDFDNHTVTCPITLKTRTHCMRQQFQILGISEHFCDKGDSGAGIFLVNDDNSLSCVGILIGQVEGVRACIATPIRRVLSKLSTELGHDVTLKKFSE